MLEMTVRTVDHHPKSGSPVAVLIPRDRADGPPIALPMRSAEACSLTHELEGQLTPRAKAFALLTQALAAIRGYVAAIVVEPGEDGVAVGKVRVCLPDGWSEHQIDAPAALGLSIYTLAPLLVSDHLAHGPASPAPDLDIPIVGEAEPTTPVPAPFLRALDE